MVEPGQDVVAALKSELLEEAVTATDAVDALFSTCKREVVYRGIVDDWRNTDWAWIETTAVWFHATPSIGDALKPAVTDTAEIESAQWINIDDVTDMYASHYQWLQHVREALKTEQHRSKRGRESDYLV